MLIGMLFIVLRPKFDPYRCRKVVSSLQSLRSFWALQGIEMPKMKMLQETMKMMVGTQPTEPM
jgi:hypothetical protein